MLYIETFPYLQSEKLKAIVTADVDKNSDLHILIRTFTVNHPTNHQKKW